MKNIFIIPTDKPSRIFITNDEGLGFDNQILENTELDCQNQNIYITNDEEIKKNDWYLDLNLNKVCKNINPNEVSFNTLKKIILTTDQDLIADNVQSIDDEFLEWFIKNPNCEFIETVNTSADYEGKFRYYDFKFPKQEKHYLSCCKSKEECCCKKQETFEEIAEKDILKMAVL